MSAVLSEQLSGWDGVRDALAEMRASHGEFEQFFAGVFTELDALAGELSSAGQQLRETASAPAPAEPAAGLPADTVHELLQLQQERTQLEFELESVRGRTAELAEALAEQKRVSAQQQVQWSDEFRRIRTLLEGLPARRVEEPPAGPPVVRPRRDAQPAPQPAQAAAADPVLDSVMAQFEILQKDLARRRAAAK